MSEVPKPQIMDSETYRWRTFRPPIVESADSPQRQRTKVPCAHPTHQSFDEFVVPRHSGRQADWRPKPSMPAARRFHTGTGTTHSSPSRQPTWRPNNACEARVKRSLKPVQSLEATAPCRQAAWRHGPTKIAPSRQAAWRPSATKPLPNSFTEAKHGPALPDQPPISFDGQPTCKSQHICLSQTDNQAALDDQCWFKVPALDEGRPPWLLRSNTAYVYRGRGQTDVWSQHAKMQRDHTSRLTECKWHDRHHDCHVFFWHHSLRTKQSRTRTCFKGSVFETPRCHNVRCTFLHGQNPRLACPQTEWSDRRHRGNSV